MTERDLEHLKDLAVPAARDGAKRAAIDAALSAYDAALEKGEDGDQGNLIRFGPTETSKTKWSFRMFLSSRTTQALAASVAALVIAAPFAFEHLRSLQDTTPESAPVAGTLSLGTPSGDRSTNTAQGVAPAAQEETETKERRDSDTTKKVVSEAELAAASATVPFVAAPESVEKHIAVRPPLKFDLRDLAQKGADPRVRRLSPPTDGLGAVGGAGNPMSFGSAGATEQARQEQKIHSQALAFDGSVAVPSSAYMATKLAGIDKSGALTGSAASNGRIVLGADNIPAPMLESNRDQFDAKEINPVKQVASEPVSTFSLDVDTASYAFVRRALNAGHLPPKDAVRVEEMINYFPYDYPVPESADVPFKPTVTIMPSPWSASNKLVHIAIKGYELKKAERPKANLVFLIDVSGSMQGADRLALVKNAFRLLVDQLQADDTIGIVTYASGSGILLEPTKVKDKAKILAAIDKLQAGGSTAGAAGIQDAYRLAESNFDKAAVNRIILATDGDFNVGITNRDQLKGFVERKRKTGVFLSILGVGSGNHNDALMQALAQNGNGTAAYVDTLNEARKVLVDEASSTLFTIAKDVKVQIEWNPARVAEYRLIGYETRNLRREDFNNDAVDAGDVGSGHTMTAIYEVTPVGAPRLADDLRYGKAEAAKAAAEPADTAAAKSDEIGFLKIRYKEPDADTSKLISLPLTNALAAPRLDAVAAEQRFSVAVAAFGQLLKGESYVAGYSYDDVLQLAQPARGNDPFGYRAEFMNLVRLAKSAR